MNMEKMKAWYRASRPPFFVATLLPLTLGATLSYKDGQWDIMRFSAVLIASFLVHLNTNLANDYFEYFSGADSGDSIGGSRVLQEGIITPSQVRNVMALFFLVALALGIWIVLSSKAWWIFGIMVFAFLSAVFYTAKPVRYGYHGMGELFVGINMGPVMVVGTYGAVSGHFSTRPLLFSIPIGIMVATILYFQSLPDIETDRAAKKMTIAVRLGQKHALTGFYIFITAAYLSILSLISARLLPIYAFFCLITVPLSIKAGNMIRNSADWRTLHDRGGIVRLFYLANGIVIILAIACSR